MLKGYLQMQTKHNENLELLPTKYLHLFRVKLNLGFETRYIGTLDRSGEGKFLTDRKRKHLFRKTNSLGLNEELLTSNELQFRWVIINFEGKKMITSRMYFTTHSQVFTFRGFERQYFLPLNLFGIDKAEEYEKSISKQLGLFGEVA